MLEKRSLSLSGHRTSIALEPEFWAALAALAEGEGVHARGAGRRASMPPARPEQKLASALRVFALHAGI